MKIIKILSQIIFAMALLMTNASSMEYPGHAPGKAVALSDSQKWTLSNDLLSATWRVENGALRLQQISAAKNGGHLSREAAELFIVVLNNKDRIRASKLSLVGEPQLTRVKPNPNAVRIEDRQTGHRLTAQLESQEHGIQASWSASLRDGSNYVNMSVRLTAGAQGLPLQELIVFELNSTSDAKVAGTVQGSPIVSGRWFIACEHPLADNRVENQHILCGRKRPPLKPHQTIELSAVAGLTPPKQLRRGFLYYLECRRPRPYRPFLHYNSWYHLNIGRPDNRMTEAECLETVELIGRELIKKRGVKLDAFVWDDGWDDFNSLWEFHNGFPDGFRKLKAAAEKFGVAQGVWMSPWGGYGSPKNQRVAYGKSQAYETNRQGFSMAGAKYGDAFRDVCLKMIRVHGVVFFKFDGMGGGDSIGVQGELADDIDAVLGLTRTLRKESPEIFISATVGTWASPFWTFYADSIWRQGGDTGFHGAAGDGREKWITYRDKFAYERVVQSGPLYPLNSLMLHGLCVGNRHNPAKMPRTEKGVRHEIRSFFGSGTNLQELYISPNLLNEAMWDDLASAAKWARQNQNVLIDSHWIGGDPAALQVYGWGAWNAGRSAITLRNPSDKPQSFKLDIVQALDLPRDQLRDYTLQSPYPDQSLQKLECNVLQDAHIELQPFEVLTFNATPDPESRIYNWADYEKILARKVAKRQARQQDLAKKYLGQWTYKYQSQSYRREFLPDGTAHLLINDKPFSGWRGARWRMEEDHLIVTIPNQAQDRHSLDTQGRLVLPGDLGIAVKIE